MDPNVAETQEAIVANANYHTTLLATISELEYVPSARKQQASYIKDLENELGKSKKLILELAKKTKKERKEHELLRDSTSRRFAHKLLGKKEKYEAKESKEEREYVEALEREMTERDNQQAVQILLDEAKQVMADLGDKEIRYESAQAELHALYGRIFDGPSQAFPEDDRLEYDLHEAIKRHNQIQETLNSESRAAELLARAVKQMESCQANMQEALSYSRYDMWGGGTMADMMERSALRAAQTNATQVETLVYQAMQTSPAVQPVGRVDIARGSIMSDVFFDNIFTDMSFHAKIKQSAAQVLLATNRLRAERDAARHRAEEVGSHLSRAADILGRCRSELASFRKATFESYVAQNPPPPSYDAIASPTSLTDLPSPSISGGPAMPVPDVPLGDPGIVTKASHVDSPLLAPGQMQMPEASTAPQWGSRNPYALALTEESRTLSA